MMLPPPSAKFQTAGSQPLKGLWQTGRLPLEVGVAGILSLLPWVMGVKGCILRGWWKAGGGGVNTVN